MPPQDAPGPAGYPPLATEPAPRSPTAALAAVGAAQLSRQDQELAELLDAELRRQHDTLSMVAASSCADPSVLVCAGSAVANLTTEGYPGARFHAGCAVADRIERLACSRATATFGAQYANVQPHSGSAANLAVITTLLAPGDTLLGMDLASGGHLTHGSPASVVSRYCRTVSYGVAADGRLDYDEIAGMARRHRPRLIICGASAYPRGIDFARFRAIADEVDALLLADISHIAGLVAAGAHPSPIDHAHVTTTSTYKQLYGPRGGLILLGRDAGHRPPGLHGTLRSLMQRAVFPSYQGTPDLAAIAAKARALEIVATPEFRELAGQVVACAAALAESLIARGYTVPTGGTDNHMVLIDLRPRGLTGLAAERALEACGVLVNRNRLPGDDVPARIGSGLRLGTNTLALRGMPPVAMEGCAAVLNLVLDATTDLGGGAFRLAERARDRAADAVRILCGRYPLPGYPLATADVTGG
jgi:glycine hydroxymethyltransferase